MEIAQFRRFFPAGLGRGLGWTSLAISLVLLFTLFKLPDQQIGQLLLQSLNQQLQSSPLGIEVSAGRTRISLFPLPGLQFEQVSLRARDAAGSPIRVEWAKLKVRPSLIDLVMGRMGGSLQIIAKPDADPALRAGAWMKGSRFSADIELNQAELGESGLGLLPILAHVSGSLPLQGRIRLEGDLAQPSSILGTIQLDLDRVALPAQKIAGFNVPALVIRKGAVRVTAADGKARIESVKLGTLADASDDVSGSASGEITLGKSFDSSTLSLKIQLRISEAVNRAFFIIDALLGAGKRPDGSYLFTLTGPVYAPTLAPASQ